MLEMRDKTIYSPFNKSFDVYRNDDRVTSANPEWIDNIFSYVILGMPPGSFHTAVFANDLFRAAATSHPLNRWNDIQVCCNWFTNFAPYDCFGSKEKVENWLKLTKEARRVKCEEAGLTLTAWELLQEAK